MVGGKSCRVRERDRGRGKEGKREREKERENMFGLVCCDVTEVLNVTQL